MRLEYFGMSYPAFNLFQPRAFIFSSNEDSALIVQSTGERTDIAIIHSSIESDIDTIYYVSAQDELLNIYKNSNLVVRFSYDQNLGILENDKVITHTLSLSNALHFEYSNAIFTLETNDTRFLTISNTNGNLYTGIGLTEPVYPLDVYGDIHTSGDLYVSNIINYGTQFISGISSNINQSQFINYAEGPAIYIEQVNPGNVLECYSQNTLALLINDQGFVGIHTSTPQTELDVYGNLQVSGEIYQGSKTVSEYLTWRYGLNSNIYYNFGNVGIGTSSPNYRFQVMDTVAFGSGLSNEGPFYFQKKWDAPSGVHIIPYPDYCIHDHTSGYLNIHVKSLSSPKLGTLYVSFLKVESSNVELFSIYKHKTNNLITFTIQSDTSNIQVLTDNDCSMSWIASGAC